MVRVDRFGADRFGARAEQCICAERLQRCFQGGPQGGGDYPVADDSSIEGSRVRSGTVFVAQKATQIYESLDVARPTGAWLQKGEQVTAAGAPLSTETTGVLLPIIGNIPSRAVMYQDFLCYRESAPMVQMQLRDSAASRSQLQTTSVRSQVQAYPGFTEHAYRFVFFFGEKFAEKSSGGPWKLKTILPHGHIENEKDVIPKATGGLICYTYPQSMDAHKAQEFMDTPFVWRRDDASCAVVQSWTTNYNEKFMADFNPKSENPNPDVFKTDAVEEFKRAMANMFGRDVVAELGIKYCHKRTENTTPAFAGVSEQLMHYLHEHPDVVQDMKIIKLDEDMDGSKQLSFTCNVVDGKGTESIKSFTMSPAAQYVLYVKSGWDTMACVKPLEQFLQESEFYEATRDAADEDLELFAHTLRQLEIQQEYDTMSVADSLSSSSSCGDLSSIAETEGTTERQRLRSDMRLESEQLKLMLRQLSRRKLPDIEEASQLMMQTIEHLKDTARTLVRLPTPLGKLIVVGDLHGHLNDLLRLLDVHGTPTPQNQYLFNGDFVDRGDWGPEVCMSLFCLRLLYPESVHLNRGNHECQQCTDRYGFSNQVMHVYPRGHRDLYNLIHEAFDQLPLCHTVGNAVFVVHGGLPMDRTTLADIEALPRGPPPRGGRFGGSDVQARLFEALLWSDPSGTTGPSPRGAGCHFGEEVTQQFLRANGLRRVVRSHECVPNGIAHKHNGLVTTIFSASNYGGVLDGNKARVAFIDKQCEVQASDAWLEPYVKTQWTTKLNEEGTAFVKCREWDSDVAADTQAIQTLQMRAGEDMEQWQQSPKARALEGVRRLIFLYRVELLQAFDRADQAGTGFIVPATWADIMAKTCNTSEEFPWSKLVKYICREDQGHIPYMEFLLRYDNPFSRELADRWSNAMIKHLSVEFGTNAADKFDSLDNSSRGRLTYADLKPLIHSTIPDSLKVLHSQSVHVFALLQKFDEARVGHVTKDEFCRILDKAANRLTRCKRDHVLTEWKCGMLQGHIHERTCNECHRLVPRGDMRRHCATCDYDLCEVCAASGQLLEVTELRAVRFKKKPTLGGTKIQVQWDSIENAMRKLCQGHIDLRALFHHADENNDGFVTRIEFINTMGPLWNNDLRLIEALWTLACEHCGGWHATHKAGAKIRREASTKDLQKGNGRLKVEDFLRCLAVIDFQSEPSRASSPTTPAGPNL